MSAALSVADLAPVAPGVNVSMTVQMPPFAAIVEQVLLVTLKSALLVPERNSPIVAHSGDGKKVRTIGSRILWA